jgi:cell division septation protein DedD
MIAAKNDGVTLELGPRQIAAGLFLVVILIGLSAAAAYLAGRSVWITPSRGASATPSLAADTSQAPTAPPAAGAEPAAAAIPAHPERPRPASYFRVPEPGQVFLQVVAVDRGPAEVFAEYLTRKGFSSLVAEGPDVRSYRVLVGPVANDNQIEPLRASLEAAGFQPFVRRYR